MYISEINEFELIDQLNNVLSVYQKDTTLLSIGDDCAEWKNTSTTTISTTDTAVEDVHYKIPCNRYLLGRKILSSNLSDIAAMGGKPEHALISLGLKSNSIVEDILEMYHGISDCGKEFETDIIGGNITKSQNEFVSVTVFGTTDNIMKRSNALTGDKICVTGYLGDARCGMNLVYSNKTDNNYLCNRFLNPTPRIKEGIIISSSGVKCACDISDGLLGDLKHICKASDKGAEIYLSKIPVSNECKNILKENAIESAVLGGEDYELLFTCSENILEKITIPYTVIGTITENTDIRLLNNDNQVVNYTKESWKHFG